jgi:hypothetical protein
MLPLQHRGVAIATYKANGFTGLLHGIRLLVKGL